MFDARREAEGTEKFYGKTQRELYYQKTKFQAFYLIYLFEFIQILVPDYWKVYMKK